MATAEIGSKGPVRGSTSGRAAWLWDGHRVHREAGRGVSQAEGQVPEKCGRKDSQESEQESAGGEGRGDAEETSWKSLNCSEQAKCTRVMS